MRRQSGVLLPVTALPGPYGIGTLGQDAHRAVEWLSDLGFSAWQVLPLTPPHTGNSPYSGDSAFAGNPALIDAGVLLEEGIISPAEAKARECPEGKYRVDYPTVLAKSEALLRAAFARSGEKTRALWEEFTQAQSDWLPDYALFSALSRRFGTQDWATWPRALRDREPEALRAARESERREIEFVCFTQWIWDAQWQALHEKARKLGVEIIGDMPMFVARESADTWAHPELFALKAGQPTKVAGAPPDAFTADGQFWGNPLYDWEAMKQEDYRWFLRRLERSFAIFDRMRLDHFRGFSAFWEIPATAETAREGHWEKGPGMDFIGRVKRVYPAHRVIAEDLGILDEDVYALREASGYPGMRVLQFGFQPGAEEHLPHRIPENCVAYSGTHDNNTTLGYLYEASPEERAKFLRYSGLTEDWGQGGREAPGVRAMLRLLWGCPAELVVTTFQDLFGWGSDTRMNRPGVPTGQWEIRLTWEAVKGMDPDFILNLQRDFERMKKEVQP